MSRSDGLVSSGVGDTGGAHIDSDVAGGGSGGSDNKGVDGAADGCEGAFAAVAHRHIADIEAGDSLREGEGESDSAVSSVDGVWIAVGDRDRRRGDVGTPTDGDSVSGIGDGGAEVAGLVGHTGHKRVRPCRQGAGGETPGAVRGASDGGRAKQNAAVEDADRVSSGERSAVGTPQGWRLVVGGAIAGHRTGLGPEVVVNGRDACRAVRSDGVEGDRVSRTRRALVAHRVGNAGGVAD